MKVAVFSFKGGASKTTTALNLGAALCRLNSSRPLRLFDFDKSQTLYRDYSQAISGAEFYSAEDMARLLEPHDGLTLIDCAPASTSDKAMQFLSLVDFVLIPTFPARVACEEARDAASIAVELGKQARVLMTRYERTKPKNIAQAEKLQAMLTKLRSRRIALCSTFIPLHGGIVEAEDIRQTIFETAPRSRCAAAHLALAREVESWLLKSKDANAKKST